jgi:hypothetical protein
MSRRASLPGAAELFRSTGDGAVSTQGGLSTQENEAPLVITEPSVSVVDGVTSEPPVALVPRSVTARRTPRNRNEDADRRTTGRERHEEKITVYVSAQELFDLEHARLVLRGEHGLAIDRGRIVREALAVVLADLEAKGGQSILVRRLREI